MRFSRIAFCTLWILLLGAGTAAADKALELEMFKLKPWSLSQLPGFAQLRGDMSEAEPNDSCPGNLYTMNETYHGEISEPGDEDWIAFFAAEGDQITIGTDADASLLTVDTIIELYANDCTTLLASDDDNGPGLYSMVDRFQAPYDGAYYLRVRGFSPTSSGGNYVIIGNASQPLGTGTCPVVAYASESRSVNEPIPDNDPGAPLEAPPIQFDPSPGFQITDVVIGLDIEHTWVGDLVVTLKHTSSGGQVREVDLVHRPGVPPNTFGCAGDLVTDEPYFFGSGIDLTELGEADCPTVIEPACYAVSSESALDLEVFRTLPVGDGTWELFVSDNAVGDTGHLHGWTVYLLTNAPVSVNPSSWGSIKSRYRE